MKRTVILSLALLISVAVMAASKATVYFTLTPQMNCENCENRVKTALRYEKGVKQIATSLATQVVTVTYDPAKTSPEKMEGALKKIGYTAMASKTMPKVKVNPQPGTCPESKNGKCSHGHK